MRQIVYFSTATGRQDSLVLAAIVAKSRAHNLSSDVTGLLVAGGHRYLQVIEGPDEAIELLLERLRRDDRHLAMAVMVDRQIESRSFDGWSMAFREEPRLDEYATFDEIVSLMRQQITDAKLREQIDCFAETFSIPGPTIDPPLWQLSPRDRDVQSPDAAMSDAFPPAAVVSTHVTRSVAKRSK